MIKQDLTKWHKPRPWGEELEAWLPFFMEAFSIPKPPGSQVHPVWCVCAGRIWIKIQINMCHIWHLTWSCVSSGVWSQIASRLQSEFLKQSMWKHELQCGQSAAKVVMIDSLIFCILFPEVWQQVNQVIISTIKPTGLHCRRYISEENKSCSHDLWSADHCSYCSPTDEKHSFTFKNTCLWLTQSKSNT